MGKKNSLFEQLKVLLNQVPCGIGIYGLESNIPVFLNDAYYNIVGYTEEEYRRVQAEQKEVPVWPADFMQGDSTCERHIIHKNGQVLRVKVNVSAVLLEDRQYAFASFVEVTKENDTVPQLNMIAENVLDSISIFSMTETGAKLIFANGRFFQLIGVDREHYQGNEYVYDRSFVSDEDYKRIDRAVKSAVESGTPGEVVHKFFHPAGKTLWLHSRYAAVRQNTAGSYLLISAVSDITEEKNAEILAALEHRRYQLVIDELNAAVFESNLKDGSFYCSAAYQKYALSKVSPDDVLNNCGAFEAVHQEDVSALVLFFQEMSDGKDKTEAVIRLKMLDGSYRWSRMIGLVYRDENGNPDRTAGIIIDTDEDREKTFMIGRMLNELSGGVAIFKFAYTLECLYFSDGFAKISGRTKEEVEELVRNGSLIETVIFPSDYKRFSEEIYRLASKGLPINLTYRYITKNADVGWLHLSASKMREEDGCPVYYCVFTNPSDETSLYKNIVEDSAVGIYVGERDSEQILYMNETVCRIYGITSGQKEQSVSLYDAVPHDKILLSRKEVLSLKEDCYSEFHVVKDDSRYYCVKAKALTWNGIASYILYITDETAEHEKQLRMQDLVDRVPGGIGIFDIVDGTATVRYMNNGYYCLIHDTREDRDLRTNGSFINGINPDDIPAVQAAVESLAGGEKQTEFNYRAVTPDGGTVWIHVAAKVTERTEHKITVFCSFTDMNEAVKTQEQLRESSGVLEAAINSADMTVWYFDPAKRCITQTQPSIMQHGFDPVIENVPESLIENGYVHKDSVSAYRKFFAAVMEKKEAVYGDFLVRMPRYEGYWWERIILTPVFNENGALLKIIGTSTNVTERKEKEARYLRQLESMSEVDDENLIAKGQHNLTKNETLFFYGKRRGALSLSQGGNYDDAMEKLLNVVVQQSKKEEIRQKLNRKKLLQDFADDKAEGSIEYKRLMPGGKTAWVVMRYSLFEEPATNDIITFMYSYDITDRVVDAQIVSKLSSMEYDALGLLDVKTRQYVLRNILTRVEGAAVIGSGDFEEQTQHRLPEFLVPSERDAVVRQFRIENIIEQLKDKSVYYFTYSVIDDDGNIRRKKCQFSYLDDSRSVILYCRSDITDMYQKEQKQLLLTENALDAARHANKAKSEFLSRMSHDIRTPMNAITNLTRLVIDEIDDKEKALADLRKIDVSNQFLLSLVNDILDMSRIEQKNIELHFERCSYHGFLNYVRSTFEHLSAAKNIHFTIEKSDKDVDIMVDKVRFNQLCFNLISNAIKYTPSGGHVVFRMVHGDIKDGKLPCDIYVIDDGIGMSKDFQKKMFDAFSQEGRAFKSVEGTGLGLSIVKEIVDLFGGTIEVESDVDKGSVFHVFIEMTTADNAAVSGNKASVDIETLAGKHILLAEDHALNQEIARRLLANVGVSVAVANNGQEAVDEFKAHPGEYDAILMDMRMPVMDGLSAAKAIRQLDIAEAKIIPIIAMTANAFAEDRAASAAAGMNAHLAKPIDPAELYSTMAKVISSVHQRDK